MTTTHPHYQNAYHLQHITEVAPVDHYDPSHGLFGELIDPTILLKGLHLTDNVGRLDDPTAARATQAMHSFLCQDTQEVCIEFENLTSLPIVLRWVNEKGECFPHFSWTLAPFSSKVQYSRLGHLFVLSIQQEQQGELLLGGYRIHMPLPSGSPHYILVEPDPTSSQSYHMEAVLADSRDELMVASAALDTVGPKAASLTKTIQTLSTIVGNLQHHPDDPKFQSLRLSNPALQKTAGAHWGARQLLHSVGFRQEGNDRLVWKACEDSQSRLTLASTLLQQLAQRSRPGFVVELAPTPPWQGPVLNSTTTNARSFGSGGTNFLSDDEKWNRADRNRGRRGRSGRRPDPGNAPSSNGPWGR